jgi:hypothetical protein
MGRFRKGRRHKLRVKMLVPVRVRLAGSPITDLRVAHTLDATEQGVKLSGITGDLIVGDVLEIHYRSERGWFRVIWIQEADNPTHRQIGAVNVESDKNIWAMDFPNDADEYEEPEQFLMAVFLLLTQVNERHGDLTPTS